VETLKEQNLNALQGDIGDAEVLAELDLRNIESIFIVSSDIEANKKALAFIKKAAPDVQVVARASNYQQKEEMEAAGADLVVLPSSIPLKAIASAIVQYIDLLALFFCKAVRLPYCISCNTDAENGKYKSVQPDLAKTVFDIS